MTNKINIVIVGAAKTATSSLLKYLKQHPEIKGHNVEELTYFLDDSLYTQYSESEIIDKYFEKDLTDKKLIAKSVDIMYSERAISRLYTHNPNAILVVMMREPVARAYSAYWYAKRRLWENASSFEEAISLGPDRFKDDWVKYAGCDYLGKGEYSVGLKKIFKFFPRDQLYTCLYEDFRVDANRICNEIFIKAGLRSYQIDSTHIHNARADNKFHFVAKLTGSPPPLLKKMVLKLIPRPKVQLIKAKIQLFNTKKIDVPDLNVNTRQELQKHFKGFNNDLIELLQIDLKSWEFGVNVRDNNTV